MHRPQAPFSVARASDSSGFLLWQVTALWQRRITMALRPYGLTQVQYALLASLLWMSRTNRAITQAMLARHAKLDVMMTSQVLRALEGRGLIERGAHPRDTRAKALRLTKAGRTLVWKTVPMVEDADREFFSALGDGVARFNRSLHSLIASREHHHVESAISDNDRRAAGSLVSRDF
jgi:DNA-binding MarR family transcriptional regulator